MPGKSQKSIVCSVCGREVEQPPRGYRLRHAACVQLHEDLERLRKHVAQLAEGTHPAQLQPEQLATLRFELFCLASDMPRPRDAQGRFVSSGLSPSYDDLVQNRRDRAAKRQR